MKRTSVFFLLLLSVLSAFSAEWQWSVELKGFISGETNAPPRAFLWIPPTCKQVRAVVIGQHNMSEEGILEHPEFRKAMQQLDFAEIWVTPGFSQAWGEAEGAQEIFEAMMADLADVSGYAELKHAPIVPIGHSAMATYPWNFGVRNPERTLAMLSIHGDAPRTHLTGYGRKNEEWGERTIEGVPGLMVMGEYEWWEDRLFTAFDYRREYPNAPVSMLADAGRGHFDHSDGLVNYLALFLKKAAKYRLPKEVALDKPAKLTPVRAVDGWLVDRWRKDLLPQAEAATYSLYQGNKDSAFWYFDREMAQATEKYYGKVRNKKEQYIGFTQGGELLGFNPESHARITATFQPESDGLTFCMNAVYTDSSRVFRSNEHSRKKIKLSRICGPVEQVNDTTFTIRFYRMGLDNPKRTPSFWLLAESEGDEEYKSTVQQFTMNIPYRITNGKEQEIVFPALEDVKSSTRKVVLNAKATSALPVYYYVKEGPAEICGNEIRLTKIPPRSKYPVRVTVVAWQYGIEGEWKSAEAVERRFLIK